MLNYPAYKELMFVLIYSIVLVGGDGSYHQAVNSLQRRLLKEAGLDENDPATDLPRVPFPIGIIPAGLIIAFISLIFCILMSSSTLFDTICL